MRNILGLELSRRFGLAWTPADKPVEVVLNGEYIGLYFLTETIRVDEDRVNIVEQPDNITDPEAITGGWLLEIDNYDTDPHVRIHENGDNDIIFTYKTPRGAIGTAGSMVARRDDRHQRQNLRLRQRQLRLGRKG